MGVATKDGLIGGPSERPDKHVVSSLTRREMDASSLSVVDAGRESLQNGRRIGPRTLTFYDLVFVTGGSGWLRSGTDEFPLKPGDLFVLFPHVPHAFASREDECMYITYVAFTGRDASDVVESRFGWSPRRPVTDVSSALGPLLDLIDDLIETMGGRRRSTRSGSAVRGCGSSLAAFCLSVRMHSGGPRATFRRRWQGRSTFLRRSTRATGTSPALPGLFTSALPTCTRCSSRRRAGRRSGTSRTSG